MSRVTFWGSVAALVRKDLVAELRSRELVGSMGLFALLAVVVFSFALQLDVLARREAVTGVLWVTVTFASVLGQGRAAASEREGGGFEALLLAPVDRAAIYIGKALANTVFALAVGWLLLPLCAILFGVPTVRVPLMIGLALGVAGLSAVGTILAAMTVQARGRDALLLLVMLPVALPLLLAGTAATNLILAGQPGWAGWLGVLAALGALFVVLGVLLFDAVVEA